MMNYRRLGKTGRMISEVGFGYIPIIRLSSEDVIHVHTNSPFRIFAKEL